MFYSNILTVNKLDAISVEVMAHQDDIHIRKEEERNIIIKRAWDAFNRKGGTHGHKDETMENKLSFPKFLQIRFCFGSWKA